jgi:superfamily II DNA or RNA helicase
MTLREYQQDTIDALERDWSTGLLRLGVSLPTGTGKTHIMSELANRYASWGNSRYPKVLVLVHRDTLVEQTERKMREHAAPGVTVGVVKADRNVVGASITIASIHTLRSAKRLERIVPPELIIVDEAHVSMSATYARVFERFPNARVAGFTATWVRSDSRKLGDFWQKISYQRSIRWAIRERHLVMPRGIAVGVPEGLLDGVRTTRGDYREDALGEAVSVEEVRANVVRGFLTHTADRANVLFAPTVAAAEYFRAGLTASGVPAAGIYATTGPRERRRIFDAYRRREIPVLTTCTALAEGWDAPWCSAVLMVRPTRHIGTYIQMIGRVLRLWPGKSDALVLDFVSGTNGMSLSLDAVLSQSTPEDENAEVMDRDERLEPAPDDGEQVFSVGKGTRPVDLFAGTPARWLVTDAGIPFVATRQDLYFLCEVGETWNVGRCRLDQLRGGEWLREGLIAGEALEYAGIVAVDDDASVAGADSRWRRGRPTQAQIYRARSIGCLLSEHDDRGAVADKLTIRQASITLDPTKLMVPA